MFLRDDAHFLFLRLNQQTLESNPEFKGLKSIQEAMASHPAPINALAGLAFPKRLKPYTEALQGAKSRLLYPIHLARGEFGNRSFNCSQSGFWA